MYFCIQFASNFEDAELLVMPGDSCLNNSSIPYSFLTHFIHKLGKHLLSKYGKLHSSANRKMAAVGGDSFSFDAF